MIQVQKCEVVGVVPDLDLSEHRLRHLRALLGESPDAGYHASEAMCDVLAQVRSIVGASPEIELYDLVERLRIPRGALTLAPENGPLWFGCWSFKVNAAIEKLGGTTTLDALAADLAVPAAFLLQVLALLEQQGLVRIS